MPRLVACAALAAAAAALASASSAAETITPVSVGDEVLKASVAWKERDSGCSRTASREAAHILQAVLYSKLDRISDETGKAAAAAGGSGSSVAAHVELPQSCPLRPQRNRYHFHENHKSHVGADFICSICGKRFRDEAGLDHHFSNRHHLEHLAHHHVRDGDTKQDPADICPADFCDVLRCPSYSPPLSATAGARECKERDMVKLRYKCQALFHGCIMAVGDGPLMHMLHDAVIHHFCDALDCTTGADGRSLDSASRKRALASASFLLGDSGDGIGGGSLAAWLEAYPILYYSWVALVVLLVLFFYGGLYYHKRSRTGKSDLRRLRPLNQAQGGNDGGWFSGYIAPPKRAFD